MGILISIAVCLIAGSLFGKVWINLIDTPNFEDVNVYEDATVVLGEVDRLYHRRLMITSDHVPLGQHKVDIYGYDSNCKQLPTVPENLSFKQKSNSSEYLGNYTHIYLRPGSVLEYKVTPVGGKKNVNADIQEEYVYITFGPEINLFTPRTCGSQSSDCAVVDQEPYNGTILFHSFTSNQRGYYNVHVQVNSEYIFELNITSSAIDRNLTEYKCSIVEQGNSLCYIDLPFKVSTRKVCLIAFTGHPNTNIQDFPRYVTLEMEVTHLWMMWVLVITVLPFAIRCSTILLASSCSYCGYKKYRHGSARRGSARHGSPTAV